MDTTAATPPARARLGTWPYEPGVAHLVLLDHHMVPGPDDIGRWLRDARSTGARTVRTGALFPDSTGAFLDAGFRPIDRLVLLARRLGDDRTDDEPPWEQREERRDERRRVDGLRLRRLRRSKLPAAAAIDRRAFPPPWADDVASLADILTATPHHRARCAEIGGSMVGFALTGRADRTGYVQRLAVDPGARRQGVASALLADALRWLRRAGADDVLVNTATDNHAALALYRRHGFAARPAELVIAERSLP